MKKFIAITLIMIAVVSACASPTKAPTATAEPISVPRETAPPTIALKDISGIYILKGTNFDGSGYTGEVRITKSNNIYNLVWSIGEQQAQTGTGEFNGTQLNGRWQEGNNSGDIIYTLQSDGSLSGIWTADGRDGQGTETLAPLKDISGIYILKGTNFDGSGYTGEVRITKSNNIYNLVWSIGEQQAQTGTGEFNGTQLNGRWQEGNNSGDIIYTLQSDGSLSGIWTADGRDGQGTETLIPKQ